MRTVFLPFKLICILLLCLHFGAFAQVSKLDNDYKALPSSERHKLFKEHYRQLQKSLQADDRHDELKETIITGNQIRVLVTNQGSISTPSADDANADLVWPAGPSGLGYAYEFGPLVAAEVLDSNGDTIHIVSDGFFRGSGGEFDPATLERWGWEPKLGFSDPASNEVATFSDLDRNLDGKPDSWPESWFNDVLGRYVWPAFLGDDATTPDEEVYYVMDDFDNIEFDYQPSPNDLTINGLGLELQVRIFQFNNPLAEDLIFLVYTITNVSEKTLNNVHLGMFGDPHVGGPGDFSDDNAGFISIFDENFPRNARNMLYAWDNDDVGDLGKDPGYFGYRFLESPGLEDDGFDNDNDGLIDESPFNDAGVFQFNPVLNKFHWSGDEDGDWDEEFDDVGVDGLAGTGDLGEGDGKPNQRFYLDANNNGIFDPGEAFAESRLPGYRFGGGEPNFGFLDTAESDQLGLTSFNAIGFGGSNDPSNDPLMWDLMSTPNQRPFDPPPQIEQEADNVFIYGSGPFILEPGESQRFSIALMMGLDFDDLVSNALISQQIFENDYRFAQPPKKPNLVAVPDKGKVTLYWDSESEQSFDPFIARANPDSTQRGFDFEGYRIYRSRDWSFNDTKTITDSRGIPFLSVPLEQPNGLDAQWDLINQYEGLSDIEYAGRGVRFDLGKNTGLVHSYVDSNNVIDGVTYFYAVTAYDRGDENADIPPSETQRTIQRDAVTREFTFDVNTAAATPGGPANGYVDAFLDNGDGNNAIQEAGDATGRVSVDFLNPLLVKDNYVYNVQFEDIDPDSTSETIAFSILDLQETTSNFVARDTFFVRFGACCPVQEGTAVLSEISGGSIDASLYEIDYPNGRIRGVAPGNLPEGKSYSITYKVKPVSASTSINGEDDTPTFDGVRISVNNEATGLDSLSSAGGRSGFTIRESGTNFSDETTQIGMAEVGNPQPYPSDFEFRFVNYDTTADGNLVNPADSSSLGNVRTPFTIVDVATGERVEFFIAEAAGLRNNRWDWQETINLIRPNATVITQTTYRVKFSPPVDTAGVADTPVYPGNGDVFLLFSTKPFDTEDRYTFTTKAVRFDDAAAREQMDDIIVVPNPYISFSATEIAGVRTGDRDDRKVQFRNLPERCTIRIYTIVGELIATLDKNDPSNFLDWNLLSFESQEIAYGVYIYHVDAPGVGTKIGRLAILK